ncbi:olfactomedin-4 [Esox lucius]|uniref:Olfactomedin-like domain-containing protein n=1 Tax=Esox lucius TaxID=8010 RepID=A0AAY5K0A9_ESOLU|nr:olfactomedin-4 [Esox lucius]
MHVVLWTTMKPSHVLMLIMITELVSIIPQVTPSASDCVCDLTNTEQPFPHNKLQTVENRASKCTKIITPQQSVELESLLLGLDRRLPQLEADLAVLEKEDDGDLYGTVSLQVIEHERAEIQQLINKLNSTTLSYQRLNRDTTQEVKELKDEMGALERFDTMQVVREKEVNKRLRRDLDQCQKGPPPTVPPPEPASGNCPHGHLQNVTGPNTYSATEYGASYPYGSWGRDPKPAAGKESWFWMVPLTSSNVFSNFVRLYSSLSSLVVGVSIPGNIIIHSSNPTTNTIQGPNVVMYEDALYYNCYNRDAVCCFNITTKTVTSVAMPKGTGFNSKFNFCHLEACYGYTDLDLATDESGVWVIYSTSDNLGNLILSEVIPGLPPKLGRTWNTSAHKRAVTNTFMACGVLYATRYLTKEREEIFYSFDTVTGRERYDVGIELKKMSTNIQSLNYSPVDHMLYAYSDSMIVSYKVHFV